MTSHTDVRTRWVVLCLLALFGASTAPSSPDPSPLPALQGDAVLAELERRGEKASLLAALDAARYEARTDKARPATVSIDNTAHSLQATFAADGVELATGGASLRLRPVGIGYGDALQPMTYRNSRTAGARVEIDRSPNVTEWWINRATGLEQGVVKE